MDRRLGGVVRVMVVAAVMAIGVSFSGCNCGGGGGTVPTGGACTETQGCIPGNICYSEVCVGEGVLRFTLSWNETSDWDIHVVTPTGTEIYWGATIADGGELDLDDCVGGTCANPTGTHVENIFFADSAPAGAYQVWVENYDGLAGGAYTIDVSTGDVFSGTLGAVSGEISPMYDVTF